MLDASEGMLVKAKAKLQKEITSGQVVCLKQHYLPDIPYQVCNIYVYIYIYIGANNYCLGKYLFCSLFYVLTNNSMK